MITAISLFAQALPNCAKSSTMIVKDLPSGKDPGMIRPSSSSSACHDQRCHWISNLPRSAANLCHDDPTMATRTTCIELRLTPGRKALSLRALQKSPALHLAIRS
jgi:hypothetical protein